MTRNDTATRVADAWRGAWWLPTRVADAGRAAWCVLAIVASLGAGGANALSAAHAQDHDGGGPTREDVADFVAGLRADLLTCGRGWHGALDLEIAFAPSGSVTDVTVRGEGAPDHVTSCVASVVRGGHVRPFTEPAAIVEHTIRL